MREYLEEVGKILRHIDQSRQSGNQVTLNSFRTEASVQSPWEVERYLQVFNDPSALDQRWVTSRGVSSLLKLLKKEWGIRQLIFVVANGVVTISSEEGFEEVLAFYRRTVAKEVEKDLADFAKDPDVVSLGLLAEPNTNPSTKPNAETSKVVIELFELDWSASNKVLVPESLRQKAQTALEAIR